MHENRLQKHSLACAYAILSAQTLVIRDPFLAILIMTMASGVLKQLLIAALCVQFVYAADRSLLKKEGKLI
jgi:hypothetical protein